jgi:hypothetical protein
MSFIVWLTRLHAINRVIVCSLICNRNLACGESTRLDCYIMIATTGDYGMAIIMLGRLYFMLSCWLTPTDALFVLYGWRAGSGASSVLTRPHLSSGVSSKAVRAWLLVEFWCEDTYHVGSLDPSSSWDRTCPWNLARWCTLGLSLGGASGWSRRGSGTGPDTPPWSAPA